MVWDFFGLNAKIYAKIILKIPSGFINIKIKKSRLKLAGIFVSYLLGIIFWNGVVLVINFHSSRIVFENPPSNEKQNPLAEQFIWPILDQKLNMQNVIKRGVVSH